MHRCVDSALQRVKRLGVAESAGAKGALIEAFGIVLHVLHRGFERLLSRMHRCVDSALQRVKRPGVAESAGAKGALIEAFGIVLHVMHRGFERLLSITPVR